MKISYAITVCNEHDEIKRLLEFLTLHKRPEDEIVVQYDEGNTTDEVLEVLNEYMDFSTIYELSTIKYPLNKNFASFKNNLTKHCTGDYIFQIDADEIPNKYLINLLPDILKNNPIVEVFLVPRINTVEGLTEEHIKKWGWRVDNGRVNFPDYQCRILKNSPKIQWVNRVHERLQGYTNETRLPLDDEFCLHHPKGIERQEKQNELYSKL